MYTTSGGGHGYEDSSARNRGFYNQIYNENNKPLFKIAVNIVKDYHLAEDVMQEVWIKFQQQEHKFNQEKASASTWLTEITKNTAIDVLRSGDFKWWNVKKVDIDSTHVADDIRYAEQRNIETYKPFDLLEQLNKRDKRIMLMHFYAGYTQGQIAKMRSMKVGTVKDIIARALKLFRKDLTNDIIYLNKP